VRGRPVGLDSARASAIAKGKVISNQCVSNQSQRLLIDSVLLTAYCLLLTAYLTTAGAKPR